MLIARLSPAALHAALLAGVVLVSPSGAVNAADEVSSEQIVRALAPAPQLTRGLSAAPQSETSVNSADIQFIESLRQRGTRSLSMAEREQIAALAGTRPAIDLEIGFDYDSAKISEQSQAAVQELGKALSNPVLKGSTFVVAGHTDAVGSESYNRGLSERRAETIKRVLTGKFGLNGADLVTVGYGEAKPKTGMAPTDPRNRRVQVVNLAGASVANR